MTKNNRTRIYAGLADKKRIKNTSYFDFRRETTEIYIIAR